MISGAGGRRASESVRAWGSGAGALRELGGAVCAPVDEGLADEGGAAAGAEGEDSLPEVVVFAERLVVEGARLVHRRPGARPRPRPNPRPRPRACKRATTRVREGGGGRPSV